MSNPVDARPDPIRMSGIVFICGEMTLETQRRAAAQAECRSFLFRAAPDPSQWRPDLGRPSLLLRRHGFAKGQMGGPSPSQIADHPTICPYCYAPIRAFRRRGHEA
jgi:hypothetical protein